ncbi:hypothetical protein U1Q18_021746 [Sarracenia purpurea var. burkii]
MDSVASTSSPPDNPSSSSDFDDLTQPVADRIIRAFGHRLRLLHRSESDFFVLGATGNVYTVALSETPSCTCPDRATPCKHILFVLIRVLGVSLDDACIRRTNLRPCQLSRLLNTPESPESLAGAVVRERFHQLFFLARQQASSREPVVEIEDGATCPVCLEELRAAENVVACGRCRNPIHEQCFLTWKKNNRRRSATCVICRARWRNSSSDQETYLNLSAYVSENDMADADAICGGA